MSNIDKALTFLQSVPDKRFLLLLNSTGQSIGLPKNYLKDIPNADLKAFIKFHLGAITSPTMVWIECRETRGVTDKKTAGFAVEVLPDGQAPSVVPAVQHEEPQVQRAEPIRQQQNYGFLGSPNANDPGSLIGMTVPQLMEMQRKADRLEDVKETLEEKKSELKKVRHEKDLLEISHREAVSKLAVATAEKDMAVLLAKTENKSFFDSPAFEKLMNNAPDMMGKMIALKTGVPQEAAGALGTANLSETKSAFVDHVAENLSDDEVNYLGSICHFLNNPEFMKQLQILITTHHAV